MGCAMNVYDFDKTIYKGDSTADFYLFCLLRHRRVWRYVPNAVWGAVRHYVLRNCSKTEFKEQMYTFLRAADYQTDVPAFWDGHVHKIQSWYKAQQRPDDVVISASPRFLLEPVCARLGIRFLIASEVDGKPAFTQGKTATAAKRRAVFMRSSQTEKSNGFIQTRKATGRLRFWRGKAFLFAAGKSFHGNSAPPETPFLPRAEKRQK